MTSTRPLPPFDNVRLANQSDLDRIAAVAAAGFFWSPTFRFQRSFYADYPIDTLSAYWREYSRTLADPTYILLVCEDTWQPTEAAETYDALRNCRLYAKGRNGAKVIVGVCSINLKPGSAYVGLAQHMHLCGTSLGASLAVESSAAVSDDSVTTNFELVETARDINMDAVRVYDAATASAKEAHLEGKMRISTLAVHPAYWRRGHATRMIRWCTRLADMDHAPLGVSATPMGATLTARAGFRGLETVRIERAVVEQPTIDAQFENVKLWIAVRPPSDCSSATCFPDRSGAGVKWAFSPHTEWRLTVHVCTGGGCVEEDFLTECARVSMSTEYVHSLVSNVARVARS